MCRICDIIGESKITPDPDAVRLGEWIDCEVAENGQPIFGELPASLPNFAEDQWIRCPKAHSRNLAKHQFYPMQVPPLRGCKPNTSKMCHQSWS